MIRKVLDAIGFFAMISLILVGKNLYCSAFCYQVVILLVKGGKKIWLT